MDPLWNCRHVHGCQLPHGYCDQQLFGKATVSHLLGTFIVGQVDDAVHQKKVMKFFFKTRAPTTLPACNHFLQFCLLLCIMLASLYYYVVWRQ